jgi:hypothetical protein
MKKLACVLVVCSALLAPIATGGEEPAVVSDLKITVLSTMLTELRGIGEWGSSIRVSGRKRC